MSSQPKKRYAKPPIITMCLQAGLLIYCIIFVHVHFDAQVFGMPLESFLVIWCPYVLIAVATAVYIYRNKDRRD